MSAVSRASAATINIAAAICLDGTGSMLVVRKHGTDAFMQPGGKLAPGEAPATCLTRELMEELGVQVREDRIFPLGVFEADAANEPGATVRAMLYLVRDVGRYGGKYGGRPTASAEIAEARWIDPVAPGELTLAPLSRDVVLPLAARLKVAGGFV